MVLQAHFSNDQSNPLALIVVSEHKVLTRPQWHMEMQGWSLQSGIAVYTGPLFCPLNFFLKLYTYIATWIQSNMQSLLSCTIHCFVIYS